MELYCNFGLIGSLNKAAKSLIFSYPPECSQGNSTLIKEYTLNYIKGAYIHVRSSLIQEYTRNYFSGSQNTFQASSLIKGYLALWASFKNLNKAVCTTRSNLDSRTREILGDHMNPKRVYGNSYTLMGAIVV